MVADLVEHRLPGVEGWEFDSSQTNDLQNRYLSFPSLTLSINRIGRAQSQDKVTEWDIELLCQWPDFPVEQHFKVTMRVHNHKSVGPTHPDMTVDIART